MIEICDDADKISHAAPLASFSDMLAEKYLWPQSDENDEERWEEYFYDDELFLFAGGFGRDGSGLCAV